MPDIIYYLGTCDTCRRIFKTVGVEKHSFIHQDIRTVPLTEEQVDSLAARAGSYEALINKRAVIYKEQKLGEQNLSDSDFRNLLLRHDTLLRRPVFDLHGQLYIGNSRKTIEAIKTALQQEP